MADISFIGTTVAVVVGSPATFDAAGFAALSWAASIGQLVQFDPIGDSSADVTWTEIGEGRTKRVNGAKDGGVRKFTFAYAKLDAGQAIVRAQNNSQNKVSFRVTDSDGDVAYMTGVVANVVDLERSAGQYKGQTGELRVTSVTVRV